MERWRTLHHSISLTSLPVISATTHKPLRLGQRITTQPSVEAGSGSGKRVGGVGGEGGGGVIQKQERKRKSGPEVVQGGSANHKKQRVQPAPSPSLPVVSTHTSRKPLGAALKKYGPLQIKDLVDNYIITPGKEKVTVYYKGFTYKADLSKDGTILYEGRRFHAASAFSVHVKRLLTPNKRGDDGWKSVHVDGSSLEEWRAVYFEKNSLQRKSNRGTEGPSHANQTRRASRKDKTSKCRASTPHGSETLPQDHARMTDNGVAEVGTDHWVQCSRCEVWRVVMPDYWGDIQADTREDWFCEDAEWDITECHPYTRACKQ